MITPTDLLHKTTIYLNNYFKVVIFFVVNLQKASNTWGELRVNVAPSTFETSSIKFAETLISS